MPKRLNASYIAKDGSKQTPVILHRAIIGTFERFMGILIEQYAGKFPIWLAPVQVLVTNISEKFNDYAKKIFEELHKNNIRVEIDLTNEKIGAKIRNYSLKKIPIIVIIGKEEEANNNITIRRLGSKDQETINIQELIDQIKQEEVKYFS